MMKLHVKIVAVGLLTFGIAIQGFGQSDESIADNLPNSRKGLKAKAKKEMAIEDLKNGTTLRTQVHDGDTLPLAMLPVYTHISEFTFKNNRERRHYTKLMRDIKVVYPYAKMAGEKLRQYEAELDGIEDERIRKAYYKRVERELDAEFGDELKRLTITQGRILIRLIDRETGDTSYELVSELRNRFQAFFFQGLARVFGHNLKSEYDPMEGEDRMIEDIIMRIEAGQL